MGLALLVCVAQATIIWEFNNAVREQFEDVITFFEKL